MTTTTFDSSLYLAVSAAICTEAIRLLSTGEVVAVIAYMAGRREGSSMPVVVSDTKEAEKLIFSPSCVNNLVVYLTKSKKEIPNNGKIAVVVKGCDMKALIGLMGESQLKRDNLYLIGVPCIGVLKSTSDPAQELTSDTIAHKCLECDLRQPQGVDFAPDVKLPVLPKFEPRYAEEIARLEAMTSAERWMYWKEQFSKCIKCYACRQVCPFCFCEQCLCDRNKPQMVESTPRPSGNLSWHLVRAIHLAGRCAGCAECERVCPMDIPLNLLNRKMAKELKELYDYEAGLEILEKGPLNSFTEIDDQSFIK